MSSYGDATQGYSPQQQWQKQPQQKQQQKQQQQNSRSASTSQSQYGGDSMMADQMPRSDVPSRFDTCKVLVSGILGVDARESYLSNGHYVMNCAVAVIGHYKAQHDWEKYKPSDTMWVTLEVWDDLAKNNLHRLQKGTNIRGVARLITNKWKDKTTGEERKQFRLRLTKFLEEEEFAMMSEMFGDEDEQQQQLASVGSYTGTSGFSNEFPPLEDQATAGNSAGADADAASVFSEDFPRGTVGQQNQYYRQRPESTDGAKAWARRVDSSQQMAAANQSPDETTTASPSGGAAGQKIKTTSDGMQQQRQQQQQQQQGDPQYPVWGDEQQQLKQQWSSPASNGAPDAVKAAENQSDGTLGRSQIQRWWQD